ncbi:unnamed protein product [Trifolium pratense]|uniref:Uncharacterized protein n=1 Tax=Trifolium pratense TaxID=57577 RepID=A0ACB0LYQ5_TRIPR|nr:unnamed protein product [Trifolium pratense]
MDSEVGCLQGFGQKHAVMEPQIILLTLVIQKYLQQNHLIVQDNLNIRLDRNIDAMVVEWTVWMVQAQYHLFLDYISLTSSPMKDMNSNIVCSRVDCWAGPSPIPFNLLLEKRLNLARFSHSWLLKNIQLNLN